MLGVYSKEEGGSLLLSTCSVFFEAISEDEYANVKELALLPFARNKYLLLRFNRAGG